MRAVRPTWSRFGSRTSALPMLVPPTRPTPATGSAAASIWNRVGGRTRSALAAGLRSLKPPLAPGYYEELEELLVAADLGPAMAARLAAGVRSRAPRTRGEATDALVAVALSVMSQRPRELLFPLPEGVRGSTSQSAPTLM